MLETFREYGRERLRDSGETAPTQRAHAAYMLVLAEEENVEMNPAQREAWLRACDTEHDNFRVAMATLIAAGDADWAMRLAGALFRFWEQRDHLTEGRETLARVLAMPVASAPARAARACPVRGGRARPTFKGIRWAPRRSAARRAPSTTSWAISTAWLRR